MKIHNLFLEITNKCQQNCIHCSTKSNIHSKDELPFLKIVDVIRQVKNLGINIYPCQVVSHSYIKTLFIYVNT